MGCAFDKLLVLDYASNQIMYTPEDILSSAYEDSLQLAKQYNFKLLREFYRNPVSETLNVRESENGDYRELEDRDMGSISENLKRTREGELIITEDREKITIDTAAILVGDQDLIGISLGRHTSNPVNGEFPLFRFGLIPRGSWQTYPGHLDVLPRLIKYPFTYSRAENWRSIEIKKIYTNSNKPDIQIMASIDAVGIIPGMIGQGDKSWLFEDLGRQAIRGLVEHSFIMLKEYHRLSALGSAKRWGI